MDKRTVQRLAAYMTWQETPVRHGRPRLTFSRTVLKPLREWCYALAAWLGTRRQVDPQRCDVLLLHYSATSQKRGYRHALVQALRDRGLLVDETAIHKSSRIVRERLWLAPGWDFIHRYYFHAAYARWVVARHSPTVILTDKNGSVLAPFLREALQPHGALVHVAHSIPTDNYRKFSMNDYDYYFVFGQSSVERLQRRVPLFGSSRLLVTGSYAAKQRVPLPARADTVLILGSGPTLEKTPALQAIYRQITETVKALPELRFVVKPHPRSDGAAWQAALHSLPNLSVASADTDIDAVLADAFVALGGFTNAAIDCALQERPYILLDPHDTDPQLDIQRMTRPCQTAAQLREEILAVANDWPTYRQRAAAFADYHIAHGFRGPEVIADAVYGLVHGQPPAGTLPLEGRDA